METAPTPQDATRSSTGPTSDKGCGGSSPDARRRSTSSFVEMSIEVPRDTGSRAPRAVWKLDGTLRVTAEATPAPDER